MTALLLTLAFVAELAAVAAFGMAGWAIAGWIGAVVLAAGSAAAWGVLAAPRSTRRLRGPALLAFKLGFFVLAAIALVALDHAAWGAALAVVACVDTVALWRLGVDAADLTSHGD